MGKIKLEYRNGHYQDMGLGGAAQWRGTSVVAGLSVFAFGGDAEFLDFALHGG